MYDAGIVGCGVIGERLAEAMVDHEDVSLVAACDVVASRAEAFADTYDCRAYTDHRDLLAAGVDFVHVGVPPVHHRPVVGDALDRDTHVICEKPIAENAEVGAAMVEAAAASDYTTAINLPFRYTPGFVELRRRVAAGGIGTPKRIRLDFRFPRWPREWQDVEWLTSREQGGPLREVGTHFLFGVHECVGPIERVSARVRYTGPDAYEDSIVGHFEAGGVDGVIDLACDHETPEENVITVLGSEGALSLTEWHRLIEHRGTDDERVLVDRPGATTERLLDEFVAELREGTGDLVSFEAANRVQRVVDAVFASEGTLVELEGAGD